MRDIKKGRLQKRNVLKKGANANSALSDAPISKRAKCPSFKQTKCSQNGKRNKMNGSN